MGGPVVLRAGRPPDGSTARFITDPDLIAGYLDDASRRGDGAARALARPSDDAELAATLVEAARRGWSVLPQAGRTSLTGGAVPTGGLVLSVERLDGIGPLREDGAGGATLTAGPGVRLDALAAAVEPAGWIFPPIPTYRQAMLGGTVSTNAGGPLGFAYGPTRRWIRGLRLRLASGESLAVERGRHLVPRGASFTIEHADGRRTPVPTPRHRLPTLPKLSAGYHADDPLDLVDLFVGSEGTLGVITEVTVALAPRPAGVLALWVFGTRGGPATLDSAPAWRAVPGVRAIEWIDGDGMRRLVEGAVGRRLGIAIPDEVADAIYVEIETARAIDERELLDALGRRLRGEAGAGPLRRVLDVLEEQGRLERFEAATDAEPRRLAAFAALREALPLAINEALPHGLRKCGGDLVVPYDRVPAMAARCRTAIDAAGLDGTIWGHLADGNLHPNVLPRDVDESAAADALQETLGLAALEQGGAPLAEHGVGRHPVKQRLLRATVGDEALARMAAIKRALDPDRRLAPGVLLPIDGRV